MLMLYVVRERGTSESQRIVDSGGARISGLGGGGGLKLQHILEEIGHLRGEMTLRQRATDRK